MCIYQAAAIYSFIPKNACSTMRLSIALANGCIASKSDIQWIHANNNTFLPTTRDLAAAEYTFVVLRDPFRRLASCYLDQIVQARPSALKYCADRRPVSRLDRAWRVFGRKGSINPADLSFRQFVIGLRPILTLDIHWRPQIDFMLYENYDDWFCVEEFPHAIETLRRRIGLVVHDARQVDAIGMRHRHTTAAGRPMMDVPAREHAAMQKDGIGAHAAELYDAELIDLVRSYYAADLELYRQRIGRAVLF